MKPKPIAPKKYPDINSAPVKRLLKWIITTVSSTGGGVTYTQVKNFANSTERKSAASYDVKDILQTFLDHGRLQKVGYKYVLPQSPNKKQVAKKGIDKKEVLKKETGKNEVAKMTTDKKKIAKKTPENKSAENRLMQNVRNSPPEIKVKRSPGNLQVRDVMAEITQLQGAASNEARFPHTMDAEMPLLISYTDVLSQKKGNIEPTQTVNAEEPLQNTTSAELSQFFQNVDVEETSQNTEDVTSAQNVDEDNGTISVSAVNAGFNE
ncbi:hypothetical protein JTE90_022715 [Oedothorax gibbosus]|uniref:H15 domain-containing protein n=1 Tax=Oedothorax gibbosus TaxID=931172 RepID=A0AAV6UPD8_9ARAC|nr:hypothetical protein JTE90_022715 [Oedothorax gibbosus]